jgi:hypothetical protein
MDSFFAEKGEMKHETAYFFSIRCSQHLYDDDFDGHTFVHGHLAGDELCNLQ